MISLDTLLDFSVLEAERIKPSCEHSQHGVQTDRHADGGEQYVRIFFPCGCLPDQTIVFCDRFVKHAFERKAAILCNVCSEPRDAFEVYKPLGSVE